MDFFGGVVGVGWDVGLATTHSVAVLIRITTRIQEYLYHWKMVENGTYIII